MKASKLKDNKHGLPKISRSHLRRNTEKSPTLSPRKVNNALNNAQALKSCLIDNQLKARNSFNSVQITPPDGSSTISSDDDSDHINVDKLKTIRNKAAQRSQQQKENIDISAVSINKATESSAILIQKTWRGYHTRKKM